MNTVTDNFNTITVQMTEMSQQKIGPPVKTYFFMLAQVHYAVDQEYTLIVR